MRSALARKLETQPSGQKLAIETTLLELVRAVSESTDDDRAFFGHLNCNRTVNEGIVAQINGSRTALSDFLDDLVFGERLVFERAMHRHQT